MKEKVLSIIIPAHNSAITISRAIDSILQSDIENLVEQIEVIVVENGSSDNTAEIIQNYVQQYPELISLYTSDPGVSKARNYGISRAKGEWLFFLDADDYVINFRKVLAYITEGDFIGFEIATPKERQHKKQLRKYSSEQELINAKVEMISNPTKYMRVCANLYKREIIEEHNLRFNENLTMAEDSDFTLHYLRYVQSIVLTGEVVYICPQDTLSATRTYTGEKYKQYVKSLKETQKKILSEPTVIQKAFNEYILMNFNVIMVRDIFTLENKNSFFNKIKQMNFIKKEDIFNRAINIQTCNKVSLVPILCLKYHLSYLASIVYLIRVYQNHLRKEKNNG